MQKYRARRAASLPWSTRLARVGRVAVPAVAAMTLVGGLALALPPQAETISAEPAAVDASELARRADRADRSADRQARVEELAAKAAAARKSNDDENRAALTKGAKDAGPAGLAELPLTAVGSRWASTDLNLRDQPTRTASVARVLERGTKVDITGASRDGFAQVVIKGTGYWVSAQYLSRTEPPAESSQDPAAPSSPGSSAAGQQPRTSQQSRPSKQSAGGSGGGSISGAPCASGSGVEAGLVPNAIKVHRAVCARFPQVTSFGGVRPDSLPEHPSGRALDCMISDNATGWEIARWVRANAGSLGVTQVIFDQHIWTTQRSGEGWRTMSDRGGTTANHRDHVHVTVR